MLSDVEAVWILLTVAALAGMWWLGYRMEPHWSSKDGRRFLCNAQELEQGEPVGRPRETRVLVLPDGMLLVSQKRMLKRRSSRWQLTAKSPAPPKKTEVYVATLREDGEVVPAYLALRLPAKSRCVPMLDAMLAEAALNPPSRPGSGRPAGRADRG